MGRARPLAIDDLVKVIGIRDIRLLQCSSECDASGHFGFDRLVSLFAARGLQPVRRPKVAPSYAMRAFLKSLLLSTISSRVLHVSSEQPPTAASEGAHAGTRRDAQVF
jgi:hypothetical protein